MNQTERLELAERIRQLDALSDGDKASLLALLREQKKYGIVWEDKPEEAEERLAAELPVLTEVKERFIPGATDDAPNHILIEGDNLHALTALSYTHEGKIDVIYIDPPYNTGNKDFVYNDSYVDREDGYRHSKWLSFMNKRLKIAKRLLSARGVIFISIDDNEQAQLKLLCDEVFGEENYIASLPRVTKKSGKDHSEFIAQNHDSLLIYTRTSSNISFNGFDVDVLGFENEDKFVEKRGKYKLNQTLDYDSLWYNPAMDFPLLIDGKTYYPGGDEEAHYLRHQGVHNPKDWVWRWSQAKFDFGYANGFVEIKKGKNRHRIYTKTYLNASIAKTGDSYFIEYTDRKTKLSSLAFVENVYSNDNAKKQMAEVIDGNSFDFPKPCSLINTLLTLIPSKNITILDFFAGSGTTLHATMQLNAEDGGRRQCILVTNNENGICENVTYERNKRVIQGYTTPKGVAVAGLTDNTLRYYRTDFVPNETTIRNKRRLMELSTDMLCIKNNLYCEQDEFAGRRLNKQKMRYFTAQPFINCQLSIINYTSMLVVYDEQVVDALVDTLAEMDVEQKIMIYVFSNTSYPHTDNFEEVLSKVELCALPSAILNAYRKICRT